MTDREINVDPSQYAEMFARGLAPARLSGVCGRVMRGTRPDDFLKLSFAPGRCLAWVLGPDGMRDLIGKTGREIVLGIGKDKRWLEEKLAEGMS